MKVLKQNKSGFTVSLEIEVSPETIEDAFNQTFKRLSKSAKIPGFRPGKVTRGIFESYYGKSAIIQDGLSDAVNMGYSKAIASLNLDIVDYPRNIQVGEYKDNAPLTFTCEVDVRPDVKLGKYTGIKVSKDPETAGPEKLAEELERLRENFVDFAASQEPAKMDDIVSIHVKASIDNVDYELWTRQNLSVKLGFGHFGSDFDGHLVNLKAGDKTTFGLTYKEDFANKDVAGKNVAFEFEVIEVRSKIMPELTDEFAQKVSRDSLKTIQELKDAIQKQLDEQAKKHSEEKLHTDLLDAIIADASMDIPNGMIEREIQHDIEHYESSLKRSNATLSQYLLMIQKTEEEFRAELRKGAENRVKAELVLRAISEKENLKATDDDLKAEVKRLVPTADSDEKVEDELNRINIEGFRRMLTQKKTFDFLLKEAKFS